MSKVFLSYSHKDQEFVEKLYRKLIKDGVECWFDKEAILWGANFILELDKGIDECDIIVLVLSPDYCQSEWGMIENTSARIDDPAGLKRKVRPLLLKPCHQELPHFLKPIQQIDISSAQKFEQEYPTICRALGGVPVESDVSIDRNVLPPVCQLPDKFHMPYRSLGPGFIGRVNDLWTIHDILTNKQTTVIEGVGVVMGTGGLGKTQLAIEYVHRFGQHYPGGVYWIDAEQGYSAFIVQLSQATAVELDNTLEEKHQLTALWRKLESGQSMLLVLDNFPETLALQSWLPPAAAIHTLVTTRRRDLNVARVPLNFMTAVEGVKLLNSGNRTFAVEAENLVETLGGFPLALELARNFLNYRPNLNIDDLLAEIKNIGEIASLQLFAEKYNDELPSGHSKEIVATFQLSWDLATQPAKELLKTMSLLAPIPVPRILLRKTLAYPEQSQLVDPIDDAVSELANQLSLVELDENNDPVMHRIIAGFVHYQLEQDDSLQTKVITNLHTEITRIFDESDSLAYRELEKLTAHVDDVLTDHHLDPEIRLDLIEALRQHHNKWGRYRQAESYGRLALEFAESYYASGHPSIARSQSNLALVLKDLGELEAARDQAKQAYQSFHDLFGADHPHTKTSKQNWESI